MKKKKMTAWMLGMILAVSCVATGCNKAPEQSSLPETKTAEEQPVVQNEAGGGETPAENPESKDTIVLKLAHHTAIDSAYDVAIKHYADLVYERTDGRVRIDVYPAAQIGGERDVLEGLELGTVDMTLNTSALIMNIVPEDGLLDLPFLFEDYDHVRACLDGEAGKMLGDKLLEQRGIRMLGGWCSGFRIMLTTNKRIESLEDFSGVKFRAPETPVYIDMFTALGSSPTPIPYGEVYTALQTGVVEGVEVAAEPMYTSKFHEVGKYLIRTNHIFSTICPLINEEKFQSLPEDVQQIMLDTMKEATDYQWELFAEADEKALQAMIDSGCELIEIDRQPLVEACADMQQKYIEELDAQAFMDHVQSAKQGK